MSIPDPTLSRLISWAETRTDLRALILTSTRAIPGATPDLLSDYDVILVVQDVLPYYTNRDWLSAFGTVLVVYRDPLIGEGPTARTCFVTQYEDGLKIDFSVWQVAHLELLANSPQLPEEFDAGYQVLMDKDGLTKGLQPPTYRAYYPMPPTESEYQERIAMCFHNGTYVAKYLWRDDLVAARHVWESGMLQEDLLPMLTWHFEIEHNWKIKPGPFGRRLKQYLRPNLWADLEALYTGPGLEENWGALFKTIELMRKAALEVGQRLGYSYPWDLDRRCLAYLQKVRNLPPGAISI